MSKKSGAPALLSAQARGHASRQERGTVPVSPTPAAPKDVFDQQYMINNWAPGVELVNDSRINRFQRI